MTVVEKPNVVRETSGLMVREARKIAKEYPGIELWETNIDAMCMWLVKNPENYGVLVASNMFGDIVSDLCAQLVGGLGFACSGNIGKDVAVFEPSHGSAPKYVGMNKVNPIAMILSAKMMLDHLARSTWPRAGGRGGRGHRRGQGAHLRHGRQQHDDGDGGRHRRQVLIVRGSDSRPRERRPGPTGSSFFMRYSGLLFSILSCGGGPE